MSPAKCQQARRVELLGSSLAFNRHHLATASTPPSQTTDLDAKAISNSFNQKASWITPRLGGVGVMTVAMFLRNTIEQAEV